MLLLYRFKLLLSFFSAVTQLFYLFLIRFLTRFHPVPGLCVSDLQNEYEISTTDFNAVQVDFFMLPLYHVNYCSELRRYQISRFSNFVCLFAFRHFVEEESRSSIFITFVSWSTCTKLISSKYTVSSETIWPSCCITSKLDKSLGFSMWCYPPPAAAAAAAACVLYANIRAFRGLEVYLHQISYRLLPNHVTSHVLHAVRATHVLRNSFSEKHIEWKPSKQKKFGTSFPIRIVQSPSRLRGVGGGVVAPTVTTSE